MINEINDRLLGKTVWVFDIHDGLKPVIIREIKKVIGRKGTSFYGLRYDEPNLPPRKSKKMVWYPTTLLFETRQKLVRYLNRLIEARPITDE